MQTLSDIYIPFKSSHNMFMVLLRSKLINSAHPLSGNGPLRGSHVKLKCTPMWEPSRWRGGRGRTLMGCSCGSPVRLGLLWVSDEFWNLEFSQFITPPTMCCRWHAKLDVSWLFKMVVQHWWKKAGAFGMNALPWIFDFEKLLLWSLTKLIHRYGPLNLTANLGSSCTWRMFPISCQLTWGKSWSISLRNSIQIPWLGRKLPEGGSNWLYAAVNGEEIGAPAKPLAPTTNSFVPMSLTPVTCPNHMTKIWRERVFILICKPGFNFFKENQVVSKVFLA